MTLWVCRVETFHCLWTTVPVISKICHFCKTCLVAEKDVNEVATLGISSIGEVCDNHE